MSIRPACNWTGRVWALALLGGVWSSGSLASEVPVGAGNRSSEPLLATAVPLPPRDPAAPPAVRPRPQPTPVAARVSVDVTVKSAPVSTQVPAVQAGGWNPARAPAPAGPEAEAQPVPESQTLAASAWMVVESTDPDDSTPVLDGGVIRSDAVFDGVAVLANDLAPVPMDALPRTGASGQYALAPQPLFSAPALVEPTPVAGVDVTELTPVDTAIDATAAHNASQPALEVNSAEQARIDSALAVLQRPLNTVTLTGALAKREPPDLASVAAPSGPDMLLHGAAWPDVKLSSYRYTVPFHHQPLYFEQPNFERCGTSCGIFSSCSAAAKFAGDIVLLPVHMLVEPPCQLVPTRGDCPTCHRYPLCPLAD